MTPGDPDWRADRLERLAAVAGGSRVPDGFGWLLDDGTVDTSRPLQLWITARMTHVFALLGNHELAEHGLDSLSRVFADPEHGGWFDEIGADGPVDTAKRCYGHDFVLLAAATAASAGAPGGSELLRAATTVHLERFWDDDAGRCVEEWDRDWSRLEDYRGANANMHAVEAYLATAAATGDATWLDRALRIAEQLIGVTARAHEWRVVEHFDSSWQPLPELNTDRPADAFRPYGATPGHAFEWARLLVELDVALADPPSWLVPAATELFDRAVADVLDDDHPLLPYTTDWDGVPLVTERFGWVMAEAAAAAETLAVATERTLYAGLASRWWSEIDEHLIAPDGSWRHELSADLEPSQRTWTGRPDAYHAVNALTLPDRLPGGDPQ